MLLWISFLYTASAAIFVAQITLLEGIETDPVPTSIHHAVHFPSGLGTFTTLISAIVSDAVILWIVLAMWPQNRAVLSISIALYVCNIVVALTSIILTFAFIGLPYPYIALVAVSLACNVGATSAIGYRAWQHRARLHQHILDIPRWVSLQKTIDLLRETGVVYCLIWLLYIATQAGALEQTSIIWRTVVLEFAIPLYPMLVVLLIARRKTIPTGDTPAANCSPAAIEPSAVFYQCEKAAHVVLPAVPVHQDAERVVDACSAFGGLQIIEEQEVQVTQLLLEQERLVESYTHA